jgi:hypothetical protein
MNWIQVEGPKEKLRGLVGAPGVSHVSRGVRPIGEDIWQVSAVATDQAIDLIRAFGLKVTIEKTEDEIRQLLLDDHERTQRAKKNEDR